MCRKRLSGSSKANRINSVKSWTFGTCKHEIQDVARFWWLVPWFCWEGEQQKGRWCGLDGCVCVFFWMFGVLMILIGVGWRLVGVVVFGGAGPETSCFKMSKFQCLRRVTQLSRKLNVSYVRVNCVTSTRGQEVPSLYLWIIPVHEKLQEVMVHFGFKFLLLKCAAVKNSLMFHEILVG